MSQTLQNQITYAKSMSGIVSLSDGAGTVIENGTIISNDISGNNITTNSFTANDLILPRKNTALIPSLGSTIDLDLLIQNFEFNPATRFLRLYADDTTYIFEADLSGNAYSIFANTFNLTTNNAVINASGWLFQNTPITFSGSSMSFGNMLPTSTLTPTLSNQLITKNYGDATYATLASLTGFATLSGANVFTGTNTFDTNLPTSTLTPTLSTQLIPRGYADGRYARLAVANTFTEQNTFRKGILPCRGTGTNPESDIQLGGNNQLQFRAATSANNISIGALSLQGSTSTPANNTGVRNIAISHNSLQNLESGSDNTFIGFQSGQNPTNITQNVAIGNYAMQLASSAASRCVVLGYNSGKNLAGNDNIIIGANVGNGISGKFGCIVIGSGAVPVAQDNSIIVIGQEAGGLATGNFSLNSTILIGYRAGYRITDGANRNCFIGSEAGAFNTTGNFNFFLGFNTGYANTTGVQHVCVGSESMRFTTTGINNTCCGFQSLYWNILGSSNTAIGHQAGVHTLTNLSHTLCLGQSSAATISNEAVLGGETAANQVYLTLPNKHRIAMNQSPTGVTITLAFRSNENVLITGTTTTTINLPTPAGTQNIGAKFNIMRQSATANNITINAPAGQTIGVHNSSGTYTTSSTYIFTQAENQVILLCISNTGNSWIVVNNNVNNNVKNISYNSTSFNGIFGTGTITGISNNNLLIGKAAMVDAGIDNIIIGQQTGGALLSGCNDNIIIGNQALNSCAGFCNANVMLGQNNGKSLNNSTDNTFIGNYISPTQTGILYSTALGSNAVLPNGAIYSTAIGYGATVTASNQIMLGRATETVRVPGTLQVSSVSAISSTITINNNIIHKKYYLSMVNPTVLTGTSPLTMSAPIYEYVQVDLASGIIWLPLSSDVEIGTVIRFRRITTMTGAISLEIQTGSGQGILARNGVTPVSTTVFLAANVTYGSVVFLSSNLWAIND